MKKFLKNISTAFVVVLGFAGGPNSYADVTMPTVTLHSRGDSYFCPDEYRGMPFSYADITGSYNYQRYSNGCSIPDTSSGCSVTCHYADREIAAPMVSIGSRGDSYYCPDTYRNRDFSRADINTYGSPRRSYNGCYIPDKTSSCDITCYYR